MIQMLPSASLAALDTCPNVQPFGMCGQDGSTANFGTSTLEAGCWGAAAVRCDPAITIATIATKTIPAVTHCFWFTFIRMTLRIGELGSPASASYAFLRFHDNKLDAR